MSSATVRENARYEINDDGVAILRMDCANSKYNLASLGLMTDIKQCFEELKENPQVKSIVLISSKVDNFISGADINTFLSINSEELTQMCRNVQEVYNDIENMPKPVIAAIQGPCLGGGCELSLSCHYRIASTLDKTAIGLPEVQLGVLPAAGGTQRLPRLINLPNALDLLLTGKQLKAKQAKKLGVVDALVEKIGDGVVNSAQGTLDLLEKAAVEAAKNIANGTLKINREHPWTSMKGLTYNLTTFNPYVRNFVLNRARQTVMKKTKGLYPSPLRILDVVKTGLEKGKEEGMLQEAINFGEIGKGSVAESLIGLFFGQTKCKRNPIGEPSREVKKVAVLGAGLMGSGIAQVSVARGYDVVMKDNAAAALASGQHAVYKAINGRAKKRRITNFEKNLILSRLTGQLDYSKFNDADIVIEAVLEDLDVKHQVIREVEEVVPEHCVIASNTSSIPIADIAKGSKRPSQVVGMHYFSPVDKMPLLEIIETPQTSKEALAAAVSVGLKQGKVVIVVKDGLGFYTTRCLMALMAESLIILLEGVDPKGFDSAVQKFGFPVGFATLLDEVGIDVAAHISDVVGSKFGARIDARDMTVLKELVSNGIKGRKSGQGIYMYGSGKSKKKEINKEAMEIIKRYTVSAKGSHDNEEIISRVFTKLVNEAAFSLQEGIIRDPVDGDIGFVFGIGFPPHLGGPFRYLDAIGVDKFVNQMEKLREIHGERFEIAPMLYDYAKDPSKKFHSKQ
ncbi:uncharacterized protein TRIADDRAFT_58079 [Trichoplax adhaerens]|uniref:enoyl-CoA hydratase n=1 Tax=Trichoplax adhaerens TaxID=10228 RepID=B3S2M5_TRIAD|nr:hypothetical protein TRIADDRAFT_58079 [Trichoplax adhaerens]EDV23122.1 hypothetical protein TRIADDRAFT_58079 [Trichoplax adhaerens]|eukprot:XP_002114032.1 hypothetical protein TRIADDRAFT_58079 [Trichoplax adhaerens]